MWRYYVTAGIKALVFNKTYAFINVVGLALSLVGCLMILLYVQYELSYDKALPNAENTYQLQNSYSSDDTGEISKLQMTSFVSGALLRKDFPQIEKMVYVFSNWPVALRNGEAMATREAIFVDGPFFDILQFPFVKGDPRSALLRAGSVVLTETEATRLFGDEDPMGKTLTLVTNGKPVDHRVTGIAKDPPKNSHIRFTLVARFDPQSHFADSPEFTTAWGWRSGWYYLTLRPGTDLAAFHAALPAWEKRNIPTEKVGETFYNPGKTQDWRLVNVRDVHLGESQEAAMSTGNDSRTIATFAVAAALILGMACVNFTNLATARASQRAREVAIRKVVGANRRQLILQFLGESILVATLAMLLALALVELLLPAFTSFLDADLPLHYWGDGGLALPIVGLILLFGIAGGLYPAFYLSRFQPALVLKANKSAAETPGAGRLRNILVVAQFAVSIGLIICTAIVYAQTVYAHTLDPGYLRDGLLQIRNINRPELLPLADTIVNEVTRLEGVKSVGRTGIGIATGTESNTGMQVPGRAEPVTIGIYDVDPGFFGTMGVRLLAGRLFDRNRPTDESTPPLAADSGFEAGLVGRGVNIVVNALAAERLGFGDAASAIGRQVRVSYVDSELGLVPATIVGVVNDSRFRSIREPIEPIAFRWDESGVSTLVVRYHGDPEAVRARIARVWKRLAPETPFDAAFSEDIVAKLYDAEKARAQTFAGLTLLAMIVACLGLFGLAAFTAERRTKEIGIRKVLGARSRDIVKLLAWQFSKPVIIANLIAWPVAWWVMRDWLNGFDSRITLGPTPFVLAGLLALAIAVGTVAGHAFKVARTNPIHALRYE